MRWLKVLLSTFFFTGYFPKCPGTAASAAALLIHTFMEWTTWLCVCFYPDLFSLPFIIVIKSCPFIVCLIISIWLSPWAVKYFGQSDPKQFVIDEAAGMFLVLVFMAPLDFPDSLVAFGLFRIFDIAKPWPIRRLEKLPTRFGLVADDLMAAIYAIICLFIFRLIPF